LPSETYSDLGDALYREYSIPQGRWLSPDRAGLAAVDPSNPQSWNRYAYVLNNPLANVDPDGEDYYLLGGAACDDNPDLCDKQGYLLDQNGNRQVVTDQQVANGEVQLTEGAGGVTNITISGEGTFQGQFFDNTPYSIDVNGAPGSAAAAVGLNFLFALDNMANDFFAPIVGFRPSYMQNIPPGTVGNAAAAGQLLAMALPLGPEGEGQALTRGGRKVLGGLVGMAEKTVAEAIIERGGGGSQVAYVASWLQQKTLAEVANLAAGNDREAVTAIKIVKNAARLAEK
jgi:RHS repeat-associated protein